ncbi:hypothetical protein ACEQPO_02040 [Bacillus sp. SL00103]
MQKVPLHLCQTLFSGPASWCHWCRKNCSLCKRIQSDHVWMLGGRVQISPLFKMDSRRWLSQISFRFPIILPSVAMYSIGAGGGSAWIDQGAGFSKQDQNQLAHSRDQLRMVRGQPP